MAVGDSIEEVNYFTNEIADKNIIHKVGRMPQYNKSLKRAL